MKTAIAMILAALATTSTATAPVANANATETKINPVALEYATEYRTTTAEVTGMVSYAHHKQFRNARRKRMGSL